MELLSTRLPFFLVIAGEKVTGSSTVPQSVEKGERFEIHLDSLSVSQLDFVELLDNLKALRVTKADQSLSRQHGIDSVCFRHVDTYPYLPMNEID